jgi:hypothetical protein
MLHQMTLCSRGPLVDALCHAEMDELFVSDARSLLVARVDHAQHFDAVIVEGYGRHVACS